MRTFKTEDVISATTGILCGSIDGVYDVLGYAVGDSLFTHQLPAASRAAEAGIVAQHPWLADAHPPTGDVPALAIWLSETIAEHGETLDLVPVADVQWVPGNALTDLVDMVGKDRVIAVVAPEETP